MEGKHLKYTLLGAAGLLAVLVLAGVPLESAVVAALALSCPLMMLVMVGGHGGHARPDVHDESAEQGAQVEQGGHRERGESPADRGTDRPAGVQGRLPGPEIRGPFY